MSLNILLSDNVFFADRYLNEEPSPDNLVLKLEALPQVDQILPVSLESLIISRLDTDAVGARCQTPQPSFGRILRANRTVCRLGQIFILEVCYSLR